MPKSTPLSRLIATLCGVAVVLLWGCVAATYVSPERWPWTGVLTLGFPFFVAAVLLTGLLVLLFARRFWYIPLVGLAACGASLRTYYPVNISRDIPEDALKVLSYNTHGFGNKATDEEGRNIVAEYIRTSGADIVCTQENSFGPGAAFDSLMNAICQPPMHWDTVYVNGNTYGLFTHFPVISKRKICDEGYNGVVEFRLLLAPKDTLIVVNCHLQSMALSQADRDSYHDLVNGPNENAEATSRLLFSKISQAAALRAKQVDLLANYLDSLSGRNIILCGDFNDSPVSYTHRRIVSSGLNDAYTRSGNGLGRSFNRDAIVVRIDNILCSDHWQPYGATVDNSINASDHNPIFTYLVRRRAP